MKEREVKNKNSDLNYRDVEFFSANYPSSRTQFRVEIVYNLFYETFL